MADGPWHIDIRPWSSWVAGTGVTRDPNNNQMGTGRALTFNLNDFIAWDVPLTAGTWTVTVLHDKDVNRGIATVTFDATTVGTIDTYNGSTVQNAATQITGIVVGADAIVRLKFAVLSKNASSSSYIFTPQHITLTRTA